jgi:hypothetical protein
MTLTFKLILMLLRLFENGLHSKMSALAPPMVGARIEHLTAVLTIAFGNSCPSLQASVTFMRYTLLRRGD